MENVWLAKYSELCVETASRRCTKWVLRGLLGGGLVAMGITLGTALSSGMACVGNYGMGNGIYREREGNVCVGEGLRRGVGGFGLLAAFSCMEVTSSVLVTEINLMVGATAVVWAQQRRSEGRSRQKYRWVRILWLWVVVCIANWVGGAVVGGLIVRGNLVSKGAGDVLCARMRGMAEDSVVTALVSGMVGNFVVGVASIMAKVGERGTGGVMGRGLFPTYAFAIIGAGHATVDGTTVAMVAGMGGCPDVGGWSTFGYFVLPVTVGNVLGSCLLIMAPMHFVDDDDDGTTRHRHRRHRYWNR